MAYLMRVVMAGDNNSGKKLISERYIGKGFPSDYEKTIGANFYLKSIDSTETPVKLQIWELAADVELKKARRVFCYGALGGILVFDVTKRETFNNLENWSKEIWENSGRGAIQLVIFGINAENRDRSVNSVTKEEGKKMASRISKKAQKEGYEIPYYEVSTKTGENIGTGLEFLAKKYILEIKNLNRSRRKLRNWFRITHK